MGLDIYIRTDNLDSEFEDDFISYQGINNLSRTFCNFMCRRSAMSGEPELDQIGRITSINISPIYQMEEYGSEEELEFFLESASSEEERQRISDEAQVKRDNLNGNIEKVLATINGLIDKLSAMDNLPQLLNDSGWDTLDSKVYFADFNVDKGDGYIGNNFGQDLRNFKKLLEYLNERGVSTVYFYYG